LSLLIPAVRHALTGAVQKHLVTGQVAGSSFGGGANFYSTESANTHSNNQGNVYEHEGEATQHPHSNESVKPISHHQGETLEGSFERKE
jgi:UPF0716 protein FxsA